MTIQISDDQKEVMLDVINHSIITLVDIRNCFQFCCDVPSRWEKWQEKNNYTPDQASNRLDKEINRLQDLYKQIEKSDDSNIIKCPMCGAPYANKEFIGK